MMDGTADLTSVFIPQTAPVTRYGQGELIAWDPDTFENTVRYNGQLFYNLDVKSGADALSWAAPQTVDLKIIDSSGDQGASQMVIDGRIIRPGAGNAEEAIAFLRGTLAKEISAEIFAARVFADADDTLCRRNLDTFGDPTTGTSGPEVVDVPISAAGKAVVFLCAQIYAHDGPTVTYYGGYMGVQVSGATSVSPSTAQSAQAAVDVNPEDMDVQIGGTQSRIILLEGLSEGLHTFTCKYSRETVTEDAAFDDRTLVVIGL